MKTTDKTPEETLEDIREAVGLEPGENIDPTNEDAVEKGIAFYKKTCDEIEALEKDLHYEKSFEEIDELEFRSRTSIDKILLSLLLLGNIVIWLDYPQIAMQLLWLGTLALFYTVAQLEACHGRWLRISNMYSYKAQLMDSKASRDKARILMRVAQQNGKLHNQFTLMVELDKAQQVQTKSLREEIIRLEQALEETVDLSDDF